MDLMACGTLCNECPHFGKQCDGCKSVKGAPWWAVQHMPGKVCPIYDCSANKMKYKNCGACKQVPCKTFSDLRDPSMTDQEFSEQLKKRLERLQADNQPSN
ncbi:MAG: DUF3795 domain-containing protein [Candidatus Riflebacteria bacterium]|nr:DUF3795 domain-containing protein [Candidatus Riflebacteria bacterium]